MSHAATRDPRTPAWLFDSSLWTLLVSNLVAISLAMYEGWSLNTLMSLYWGQSVIIGLFAALRIACLRQFSTEGVMVNDRPVDPTPQTKYQAAAFFVCHYGGFHAVYLGFISFQRMPDASAFPYLVLCAVVFFINHAFSFQANVKRDLASKPNIGTLMALPYARIIPMHLTIIFGSMLPYSRPALLLFLVLKTLADVIMHAAEHGIALRVQVGIEPPG